MARAPSTAPSPSPPPAAIATFSNLSINTAGNYTLPANDGSLTGDTSSSFTISPASAAKVVFIQQPTSTTAGSTISPAVTVDVEDTYGNLVTGDTSSVTLSVNSGSGSLNGTLTQSASGGIATFSNLSINTADTYTLTAADGLLTSATSSSFTISPASAAKVVFVQQPTSTTAGSTISPAVTVDVEDTYGNLVTTDTSSVTLSVQSGSGSLNGTLTKTATGGIATFSNLSINTADTYTLSANDGSLTGATSSSFTISPASAAKVVFIQQPTSTTAGSTISPAVTVDVEDTYGNLVTADTSGVTLSVQSGSGTLNGTLTKTASGGIATFSNLSINTADTYTLSANDGSLTGATSSSFTISPASAAKVVFIQQPTSTTAGSTISPAVTVDVEDTYGNLVTGDTSGVTLSVQSGSGTLNGTLTKTASGGIATFSNLSINTADTYTLTAADGLLTSATSSSFTISPASAAKVVFVQQPTSTTAGSTISPAVTVDVEDTYGNLVTGDTSSVILSVHSGSGS